MSAATLVVILAATLVVILAATLVVILSEAKNLLFLRGEEKQVPALRSE